MKHEAMTIEICTGVKKEPPLITREGQVFKPRNNNVYILSKICKEKF